jgi:DNA-binding transcriptional LysR family regulator
MDRFLERLGEGRRFDIVEMGTNETIKQAVMAGLGIAIISGHTCTLELRDRRLDALYVPGLPIMRQWFLVSRRDKTPTASTLLFKDFVFAARAELFPTISP